MDVGAVRRQQLNGPDIPVLVSVGFVVGMSSPITDSNTCGMDLGDYLELMVIYAVTHRLDDDTVSKHHETMARLQGIRERNSPQSINAAINSFHKTRRQYDSTYTPRLKAISMGG
jgi:hypothetical protein